MNARKRPRQNPGPACQQCRMRKLRCDRQLPCNSCVDAAVECHVDTAPAQRGPKKGHLKALRSRIAALERHIGLPAGGEDAYTAARSSQGPDDDAEEDQNPDWEATQLPELPQEFSSAESRPHAAPPPPPPPPAVATRLSTPVEVSCPIDIDLEDVEALGVPIPLLPQLSASSGASITCPAPDVFGATDQLISPLIRADLDQLYFDRTHTFVPVIHQHRYLQRSKAAPQSPSHRGLQYAMWAMAAALSSQFHHLRDSLYRDTLDQLHALDLKLALGPQDDVASLLEQAQAWILVAVYEFVQGASSFGRAWTSVGRAIRLVQLMRLSETDAEGAAFDIPHYAEMDPDSFIEKEERRRTFWMAFCLDRFACALNGLPLTLGELILTRLPCPEDAFQSATLAVMPLLSEVMTATDTGACTLPSPLSPWAECIVFSALWGRALAHQQQSKQGQLCGRVAADFRERQLWLDKLLARRMQLFQQSYLPTSVKVDPMLLFTSLIAQATVLSRQRAPRAAMDMVQLTAALAHLGSFKVHPFTPIPLSLCRQSLLELVRHDPSLHDQLDTITKVLHELSNVNNLCQYGLDAQELGEFAQEWLDLADGLLPLVSHGKNMGNK